MSENEKPRTHIHQPVTNSQNVTQITSITGGTLTINNGNVSVSSQGDTINASNNEGTLSFKSRLDHVSQVIEAMPNHAPGSKTELTGLMQQLLEELDTVPDDYREDARLIAEATEDLLEKSKNSKSKGLLQIAATGIQEAASRLKQVAPRILFITLKIIAIIID